MNSVKETNRIFGLDLMRAAAILMVLFSHLFLIFPFNKGIVAQITSLFGFLGVEIFFVLSGFLIGKILYKSFVEDGDFSFHKVYVFLKRRWFRTLPNYFLALLIVIVIASIFEYSLQNLWKYFFLIQNFSSPMLPFFPESWSLTIEEFAYILLPLSLWGCFKCTPKKNKSHLFLVVVLVLIFFFLIAKIGYALATTNQSLITWNLALKAVVLYRLDSIFIGVLCSWLYYNYNALWKKWKLICMIFGILFMLLLFVGIGFFKITIEKHAFFWNVFYLPLTSLSFSFFLPILSEWKYIFKTAKTPVTFISKISYSIYLLHYSILFQLLLYFFDISKSSIDELILYAVFYLALTLLSSWFLHRFFEKPIMDLRDKL